jgi:hypothetical protein
MLIHKGLQGNPENPAGFPEIPAKTAGENRSFRQYKQLRQNDFFHGGKL